jgi:putative MATE family efflux protein
MRKMTEGDITGHLLSYAVPLIFGNLLQLTYNAADSIIIGKCLGENALAAVSVANPIMTVVILGVSGISIGASVIMSRLYGADEAENLKKELSTTILFGLLFSLIVFAFGIVFSPHILTLMAVPAQAMADAVIYLRIIFVGFLFTFQYNIMSGALRSVGDSKTPVLFLGISSALNIGMDLLFVYVMNMGVAGAALATDIAEGISAVLCLNLVYRKIPALQLKKKDLVIDIPLLKETLVCGSLTALQQAAQPIGKVLIQSVINSQGVTAIGAFNAVCRIDDFARIPTQSIGNAVMTCVAQNRGAGKTERVKETLNKGLRIAIFYYPLICALTLILKTPLMKLLSPDESRTMVEIGAAYLSVKAWMFIMPGFTNALQGYFRGIEKMRITLYATLIQISLRTFFVYVLVPKIGITGEAYASLIGWALMLLYEYPLYFKNIRSRN